MKLFKSLKYNEIQNLVGKTVRFTSDCPILGGFDTVVIINNYYIRDNVEYVFECKVKKTGKTTKIGSNMLNLKFEILSE